MINEDDLVINKNSEPVKTIGQIGYEAYWEYAARTINQAPAAAPFNQLLPVIRGAWEAAGKAIQQQLLPIGGNS